MDRQRLARRGSPLHAEGLTGLVDRSLPGRTPGLGAEQVRELATIVETEPDPEKEGLGRWRRIGLCEVVERRFGVRVAERTMGSILRRLGFAKPLARPRHPQSDPDAQELHETPRRAGPHGAA